ncbi:serine kinase [Pseudalkalibacillus hwajinpoensis]|uniref:serine kinase n=1 Tax=Guptibacillus hwajinpoensis TaxID=208199 RepID=UPI001CD42CAC|nr:serine kinase [Pseudalkalibacillus hwajinpoensis]MCA0990693.1 serine kinase [Pseudalkalibacillus hwajinpoensis]
MRLLIVIPLILFGGFLGGLKINDIGNSGDIIMNIVGFGHLFIAILISRKGRCHG